MESTDDADGPVPYLRVIRGCPDAADLAALTAVLLARGAAAGTAADDVSRRERAVARWSRPERESGFAGGGSWWRR